MKMLKMGLIQNYTEAVLKHCNILDNNYQQDSRVLYKFVPGKSFRQLQDISPKKYILLKTMAC